MDDEPSTDAVPAGAPKPGEIFAEKYRVERLLGVGGMGYVLAAVHVQLRERVAIKMLLPERANQPETVRRFIREGRAAVKIRSEHVARVLDVGSTGTTPYIVMEYLDGSDLAAVIAERRRLPVATAVDYLLQACEAIAEAHAMDTVHRDLKPANLFIVRRPDGSECVKVLDFGISKMASSDGDDAAMTKTSTTVGTPLYMSPEQLKSSKSVDARTDIWALGIIAFELLAGEPPFRAESLAELGVQVLTVDAPDVRTRLLDVPAEVAEAIARCLRRDMRERFPTVAELAAAFAPFGSASARTSAERIAKVLENHARPESRLPVLAASSSGAAFTTSYATTNGTWNTAAAGGAQAGPRRALMPWIVGGVAALVVVAGAAGVTVAKLVGRAPATVVAAGDAAPSAEPAPSAKDEAAAVRVVHVEIDAPPLIEAYVDDALVEVRDRRVAIRGAVGSVHRVRIEAGARTTTTDVVIAESGPVPARIELGVVKPDKPMATRTAGAKGAAATTSAGGPSKPAGAPTINRTF